MRPWLHPLILTLFLCLPALPAFAQTPTFNVEGVVTDEQQAVLPGVTVTIRNVATGLVRTATTDASGRYVFSGLPPEGRYELETELPGFATQVRNNLIFNAGQRVVLNVQMKLSSVQETVTVAGDSPVVQTTSSEVSTTIDRTQFETLPVKERNYMRLLTLDSNVVASRPGTNAVNVGGGEVWNFGTYVDGTNNHSKWLTLQRAPQLGSGGFALETVKEMQIITNQFSAEFGGHAAGVSSMITKSGTNSVNGSAFVMIRPGEWDAKPPLARTKVPYNQQQFGGVLGGPMIRDKAFYFGSYERRRERSEVALTSPEATAPVVETPADEHQGQFRADIRFTEKSSLSVRYNMVRWNKDNESGGLNLPGTGFIWDNNVDTIHGTFQSVRSERFLNEVRAQYSRYTDSRAAKCEGVAIVRTAYSTSGCNDQGTWGVLPEQTYDIADTASLWLGDHTIKTGGSFTYDVTEQLFAPLQNGVYRFAGAPNVAPNPFQYDQAFALVPEARLMFPKAYVLTTFLQDDWRVASNLTVNLGVRYDIEWIKNVPDYPAPADKDNIDPRLGFAWDVAGDQKWAVRGGTGWFTQQHPIFTIVKGGVGGRNGLVTLNLTPGNPLFPTYPERHPVAARRHRAADPFDSGDLADARERARVDGRLRCPAADRNASQRGDRRQHQPRPEARLSRHQRPGVDSQGRAERRQRRHHPHGGAGRPDAARAARAERLPAHRGAHQRRAILVPGRPLLRELPDRAPDAVGVLHAVEGRGPVEPLVRARGQQRSRVGPRPHRCRYAATTSSPAPRGTCRART